MTRQHVGAHKRSLLRLTTGIAVEVPARRHARFVASRLADAKAELDHHDLSLRRSIRAIFDPEVDRLRAADERRAIMHQHAKAQRRYDDLQRAASELATRPAVQSRIVIGHNSHAPRRTCGGRRRPGVRRATRTGSSSRGDPDLGDQSEPPLGWHSPTSGAPVRQYQPKAARGVSRPLRQARRGDPQDNRDGALGLGDGKSGKLRSEIRGGYGG